MAWQYVSPLLCMCLCVCAFLCFFCDVRVWRPKYIVHWAGGRTGGRTGPCSCLRRRSERPFVFNRRFRRFCSHFRERNVARDCGLKVYWCWSGKSATLFFAVRLAGRLRFLFEKWAKCPFAFRVVHGDDRKARRCSRSGKEKAI